MSIFNEFVYRATNLTVSKRNHLFEDPALVARKPRAVALRRQSLAQAEALWRKAAERFRSRGVQVVFAETADAANEAVETFLADCSVVVKGKSLTTEETGLRQHLARSGKTVVETDLGEWIIQQRDELPSHFTAPAIHLSAAEIADMIHDRFGQALPPEPEALTAFARSHLRDRFQAADAGIIGANMVAADPGLCLAVSNEGNVSLCARLPGKLVVFTGWDRVYESSEGLEDVQRLLTASATGQEMTSYLDVIAGPLPHQEMLLVVLDNGRKALLQSAFSEAGRCIRCGACLNTCSVYKEVGGHTFGKVYHGGIGALLTAFTGEDRDARAIADYCLRCGSCEPVCPMDIPIAKLVARLAERYPLQPYLKWPLKLMGSSGEKGRSSVNGSASASGKENENASAQAATGPSAPSSPAVFIGCAFRTPLLAGERRGIRHAAVRLWPEAVLIHDGCCGMPHFYKGLQADAATRTRSLLARIGGVSEVLLPCSSGFSYLSEHTDAPIRLLSMAMVSQLEPMVPPVPVFYHQPCHLKTGPGVAERAELGRVIPFRDWEAEDRCCGSAGTFFVSHPRISRKILNRKSRPEEGDFVILTSCPSCLMQLRRIFGRTRVRHPVAWLVDHHPFFK